MTDKIYRTRVIEEHKRERRTGQDRREDDRRHTEQTPHLTPEEIAALLVTH